VLTYNLSGADFIFESASLFLFLWCKYNRALDYNANAVTVRNICRICNRSSTTGNAEQQSDQHTG
jgi:hypothetical protein